MCSGSRPLPPTDSDLSPHARRVAAEQALLTRLAQANPSRLRDLVYARESVGFTLEAVPGLVRAPFGESAPLIRHSHRLRIRFPRYYPSMPSEAYIDDPVFHPNVHPETGFICLWDRHRVAHTVEDALFKTVAVLTWRLTNPDPQHVMQPDALQWAATNTAAAMLECSTLTHVEGGEWLPEAATSVRRRLS